MWIAKSIGGGRAVEWKGVLTVKQSADLASDGSVINQWETSGQSFLLSGPQ